MRTLVVQIDRVLTQSKLVDWCPGVLGLIVAVLSVNWGTRLYLRENKRDLDIYLHCDHSEEIYRGFGYDRANHH